MHALLNSAPGNWRLQSSTCIVFSTITRLPFYLRPTTSECVHLVTLGQFRSRDEDAGHTIRSAISKNPMLQANFMAVCFVEPELLPINVLHCGNGIFDLFAPVTLTLTRWPSYTNVTRISCRYTGCANMNFLRQGVRKLLFDRQTDRQTGQDRNYIPRRFVGGQNVFRK